jgi:hypothetical protein
MAANAPAERRWNIPRSLHGWTAAGPHPDPERGYREPLGRRHLTAAAVRRVEQVEP